MSNKTKPEERLQAAIGGEWHATLPGAVKQGYYACFPRFHSEAIVGVINAAAGQVGAQARAVSCPSARAGTFHDFDPNAPHDVILPLALVENQAFCAQLTSDLKQVICGAMAHQLSRAAMQWLHAR
jgi:hypothetical protein